MKLWSVSYTFIPSEDRTMVESPVSYILADDIHEAYDKAREFERGGLELASLAVAVGKGIVSAKNLVEESVF